MSGFDWSARLETLLQGTGPDGKVASLAERRAFVAVALVTAIRGARPTSLPAPALKLLGELCQEAGVVEGDAMDVLLDKLDAHLVRLAPPMWLMASMAKLLREATLAGAGPGMGEAFARFAGQAAAGVLGGGARPEGTTPGGPLAQLALKPKK